MLTSSNIRGVCHYAVNLFLWALFLRIRIIFFPSFQYVLLLIPLSFLMATASCDTLKGKPGCSSSIHDSQNNGVFVKELYAPGNVWKINDTLQIHVYSAWIEHRWSYGGTFEKPVLEKGYQLQINTNSKDLKNYNSTWMIGVDQFAYFRCSSNASLLSDLEDIPADSSLKWKVQNGSSLSQFHDPVILGEVRLQASK